MKKSDAVMLIGMAIFSAAGFWPALRNFFVILKDKDNDRISAGGRKFVLIYSGIGVICLVLVFILSLYLFAVKVGKTAN
jgi:hypothetical protein